MNKSQHKESKRLCKVCKLIKTYPIRNETCSAECAIALRNLKYGVADKSKTSTEVRDENNNELTISLGKTRVKSLDELISVCDIDTTTWECYRFVANKWEVGASTDGKITTEPLFQVKAWFKKKLEVLTILSEIEAIKEDAKAFNIGKSLKRVNTGQKDGVVVELSIPDLHMGKLAWGKETGWADYDSQIAKQCFEEAVYTLLQRSSIYDVSEVVFIVGNDLLNYDNKAHTTTRGTPQTSTDTRYQKTFVDTRRMVTNAIKQCSELAPVRVVMVPGNHDELSLWHLGDSLECAFSGATGITIDNSPTLRKYYKFGDVGLMWTHGDKGKHAQYPLLFASERPDIWGTTKFHEVHVGHLHQVNVREMNGTRVRILPSLCAADAWHSEMGYVGNIRSAEAFIWDAKEGLLGTSIYTVPEGR